HIGVDRRDEELRWYYRWSCPPGVSEEVLRSTQDPCFVHRLPFYDRLRETHPDFRPTAEQVASGAYDRSEDLSTSCGSTAECVSEHGLPGTECIGTHADGGACLMDASAYAEGGDEAGACTGG